jgi:hypothetical protein
MLKLHLHLLYSIDRYHQAQKYVTRHVAEEARKVSGTDSLFIPEPQKPKSAKENKNKSAGGDKVYEFTSVQLKGLVVAIAQHGSAVPRDFLVNLADAERLRKECAEWYTVLQLGTPEGDASHGFFSNVLGEIFDLLKPHCKDWRLPTGTSIVDPKTTTVTNIFDVLHIEYPPEIPDVPEWITKQKVTRRRGPRIDRNLLSSRCSYTLSPSW